MFFAPHFVQSIHFVGIGGIGMSGIAEILHDQGYAVRGSDARENANVQRLRSLGIPVMIGHKADHIRGAQCLVVSTAIPVDNPELVAARKYRIPVLTRGEMLAEIVRFKKAVAISGTHGKTTTTSLIATILNAADLDPTVINGGIINTLQTNARLGHGDWMVVEADESDGSFLKIPSLINIITNIDCEHMNYYKTEENLERAFRSFLRNLPFYGLGVLCTDHPRVKKIFENGVDRRLVSYGFEGTPHFKAENVVTTEEGSYFDLVITQDTPYLLGRSGPGTLPSHTVHKVFLPMLGFHNILNALAALATAHELGINAEVCKAALRSFKGVHRRFTRLGQKDGVTFIDDYAHHPMEIRAVLEAARQTPAKRICVVFQPHRYSRFSQLFSDFVSVLSKADVVVTLPVYSAGEDPVDGMTPQAFADALRPSLGDQAYAVKGPEELAALLPGITQEGDYVVGMGAGSVSDILSKLYGQFRR